MVVPVKGKTVDREREVLERMVRRILPDAEVEVRDKTVIVRIPRHSPRLTARKLKRIRKLVEKNGFEARIVPV